MCFISPSYLSSLFKQDTGTTIVDYINSQRVDRAAVLLATTDRSIAAVAAAVGILDVNYFTKIFKNSSALRRPNTDAKRKRCWAIDLHLVYKKV